VWSSRTAPADGYEVIGLVSQKSGTALVAPARPSQGRGDAPAPPPTAPPAAAPPGPKGLLGGLKDMVKKPAKDLAKGVSSLFKKPPPPPAPSPPADEPVADEGGTTPPAPEDAQQAPVDPVQRRVDEASSRRLRREAALPAEAERHVAARRLDASQPVALEGVAAAAEMGVDGLLTFTGLKPSQGYKAFCAAVDIEVDHCTHEENAMDCSSTMKEGTLTEFAGHSTLTSVGFTTSASVEDHPGGFTAVLAIAGIVLSVLALGLAVFFNRKKLQRKFFSVRIARPEDHELMACPLGPDGWTSLREGQK